MKKAFGFMALGALIAGIGMAVRDLVVEGVFENLPDCDCDDCDCCESCGCGCDCECGCGSSDGECMCCGCEDDCDECTLVDTNVRDDVEDTMSKLEHAAEKAKETCD